MKRLAAILICCVLALSVQGRAVKEKTFVITDYGAVPDSTVVQTGAIQKAIDAAAVKGGTVVVPGGVWMSGALFFKPGTKLRLEEGAVLKGSTAQEDYPDVQVHIEGVLQPWSAALVNADGCNGFSITGKGTLDGDGRPAWEAFWARRKENPQCTNLEVRRARLVGISRSSDIKIEGVRLRNSAFWNIHLYKCSNVRISGIDVYAPIKPVKAPSSDGIDLDACCNVHISDCKLATGDDLIALKGGKGPWADENPDNGTNSSIIIEDCEFGHGPGALVLGSECIGANNIIMRRCKANGTDKLLWLKMRPDTPQHYANILVEDVSGKVNNVVYIKPWTQFFDLKGRTDLPVSLAENITVQRCTLKCTRSRNIVEEPEQYIVRNLHYQDNKWSWNYNKKEENVKPWTLPDPLVFASGQKVESPEQWPARRQEILDIFQKEMYGEMPPASPIYLQTKEEGSQKRVRMTFREDGTGPHIDWVIVYPKHKQGIVPAVMLLNYYGNEEVLADKRRPKSATVFPIDEILSRGYAFVTACYEDISPDPDTLQNATEQRAAARTKMYDLWDKDCTAGSIMAWAWGLCRGMDMLEKDARIDASRVLLTGSSRLGKAALVAGAFDERFKTICVNQTGGGGVPLAKRNFGEYVGSEVDHYGYWWCEEFAKYAGAEKKMPFDQHMLLSCIAPRRLLVEGFNNPWFDTRGEFYALQAASPVWTFLGEEGLPDVEWPANEDTKAIGSNLGYVRRDGLHGIDANDWKWMLDFAGLELPDRKTLPEPVFSGNPGYIDLYWKAWELAWDHVEVDPGLTQSPYMDEAWYDLKTGKDGRIWIWDTEFMALFCKYAPDVFPGIQSLDNLYAPMVLGAPSSQIIHHPDNPSFFPWVEWEYYKFTGDRARIDELINGKEYLPRCYDIFRNMKKGTRFPFSDQKIKLEHLDIGFVWGGDQSGMDNTPRKDGEQILWVDALGQQALSALYIGKMAAEVGNKEVEKRFNREHKRLCRLLNRYYWDKKDACYYDIIESSHAFNRILTPASFWPMLAEAATRANARKMAAFALAPEHLGGERPWKSVSASDPAFVANGGQYWRGGIWLPTAYMGIKALEVSGQQALADETASALLSQMLAVYKDFEPHTIWECYDPSADKPALDKKGKLVRKDFCGWSALGPISLFIENVIGIREVDAIRKTVRWDILHDGTVGIKRFRFGSVLVDLICSDGTITVSTNEPFTLILNGKKYRVPAGKSSLKI